mmetsp:Transcript_39261/g.45021  ORF Transcript_39261/g.45021 Transcript_39261/m.45021 type:complete len:96 (-) Transcript_39261:1230-1517(-)
MPYYTDALEAYLLLVRFSKASRKEIINNYKAFHNSMHEYKKDVLVTDEINVAMIKDKLKILSRHPLQLMRLNFYINRPLAMMEIFKFTKKFKKIK